MLTAGCAPERIRRRTTALTFLATLAVLLSPASATGQSAELERVRDYRRAHERAILAELSELVRIPNVATDSLNIRRNARALVTMLERRGLDVRLLDAGGPPYVFAERAVPGARRTILFYCHYDGQPVDPTRWAGHDPWNPVLRDGALSAGGRRIDLPPTGPLNPDWRLYGRSAADDKAPIIALLTALDALAANELRPASNLKFLFEGDEEIGSPHLDRLVREHAAVLDADLVLAADGPSDPTGRPTLFFGVRGIVTAELTVYGPVRPLHSGHYGNWAPNPAMRLAQLLASMKDPSTGRVLIEGFYDDVVPLSELEQAALSEVPDHAARERHDLGIAVPEMDGGRFEVVNLPSLNVRGLRSGWVGDEARTIVPDEATASLDLRLVKRIDPAAQIGRLISHVEGRGYHVIRDEPDLETRSRHERLVRIVASDGYPAFRTSMDLPVATQLVDAIEGHTGSTAVKLPTLGGSVPLYLFTDVLGVPTVGVPIVNHDNNQHSPNENLRLGHLWRGIEVLAAAMLWQPGS